MLGVNMDFWNNFSTWQTCPYPCVLFLGGVCVHTVSVIPSVNDLLDFESTAWSHVGGSSGLGIVCVDRVNVGVM